MNLKRLIPVGLTAVALVVVGGCSSSDQTAATSAAATPGAGEAGAAAPAAASSSSSSSSSSSKGVSGKSSGQATAAAPGHESGGTVADRDLTKLNPVAASLYKFTTGNGATKQAFTRTASSLNGLSAEAQYLRAQQRRATVAQVAVYSFENANTKSAQFRGQLLNQLVGATAKSTKVRTESAAGHTFAVAGNKTGVVGSFDGDKAVIVVGRTGTGSLSAARNAVYAYLDQ